MGTKDELRQCENVNKNIETRELQENDANKRLKEELGDKANLIEDIFSLSDKGTKKNKTKQKTAK